MTPARAYALLATLALGSLSACNAPRSAEGSPSTGTRSDDPPAERTGVASHLGHVPDALLVRFREVKGEGFSRESWEIEVLQLGGDVRVNGSFRSGGSVIPIFRPMSSDEYAEFWRWIGAYPLDRHQVLVDESAPEAEWTKTLEVDVVLGPRRRWLSKNTWTHPLAEDEFVRDIENRLHTMVLDLAETEIDRVDAPPAPSARPGALSPGPTSPLGEEPAGPPARDPELE